MEWQGVRACCADGVRCRRSASYVVVGGSNVGEDELDKQRFITVGDGSGGSNSSSNSSNLMMSTSSSNNSLGPNPSSSSDRRSKKVSGSCAPCMLVRGKSRNKLVLLDLDLAGNFCIIL